MTSTQEINEQLVAFENEVCNHLGLSMANLVFQFEEKDNQTKLDLITVNPRHNQSFLFSTAIGITKMDAAEKMLEYVRNYKEKSNSYTVQWMARGTRELQTSYFSAANIYLALDKLHFDKELNSIKVFSIALNPSA